MKKLNLDFYRRDTKKVARELLGQVLVSRRDGIITSGIMTETEAYLGITDSACHRYEGRCAAGVETMYLDGGHT